MFTEKKSALAKAMDLLARQEQSSTVLRQKLLARHYSDSEIDDALAKLKKHRYLDDEETCKQQFENLYSENKLSLRQIVVRLIQHGFDRNFIEQLIPEDATERESAVAIRLLQKKFTPKSFDKAKACRFLSSRGFDADIIANLVDDDPFFL